MKKLYKWMVVGLLIAGTASAAYVNLTPTTTYTNTLSGALIDVVYDIDKNAVPRNLGTIISTNSNSWDTRPLEICPRTPPGQGGLEKTLRTKGCKGGQFVFLLSL